MIIENWYNARAQTGTQAHTWLTTPQRFGVPFTPVQCSGLNPAERWCSIRRRKRWRIDAYVAVGVMQFVFRPLTAGAVINDQCSRLAQVVAPPYHG
jgi:hypothetical protein